MKEFPHYHNSDGNGQYAAQIILINSKQLKKIVIIQILCFSIIKKCINYADSHRYSFCDTFLIYFVFVWLNPKNIKLYVNPNLLWQFVNLKSFVGGI